MRKERNQRWICIGASCDGISLITEESRCRADGWSRSEKMTLPQLWRRLHQQRVAISDDGVANKMAQMASIFPYGPLLGPPSHHQGDEEEKITLQRESAVRQVRACRRVITNSPIDHGVLQSPGAMFLNHFLMFGNPHLSFCRLSGKKYLWKKV